MQSLGPLKGIGTFIVCTCFCLAAIRAAAFEPVILTFDDLPSGSFYSYGFDKDGDGADDIILSTKCSPGFQVSTGSWAPAMSHPGLQGGIYLDSNAVEMTMAFPGGATGELRFDFAVFEPVDSPTYAEAYACASNEETFKCVGAQADGEPAYGTFTMEIPFVAEAVTVQFYTGAYWVYVVDDLRVTCGSAPSLWGMSRIFGETMYGNQCDFDKDGDVDGSDLAELAIQLSL
jgi:hypothetical protein